MALEDEEVVLEEEEEETYSWIDAAFIVNKELDEDCTFADLLSTLETCIGNREYAEIHARVFMELRETLSLNTIFEFFQIYQRQIERMTSDPCCEWSVAEKINIALRIARTIINAIVQPVSPPDRNNNSAQCA